VEVAKERLGLRVALVHDFLLDLRGAERVFLELCRMWPGAPVFTTVYDEAGTKGRFADRDLRTSFLQRLRPSARTFRALLPLYPAAIRSLDLQEFDLVLSSSSAWAHGVVPAPPALHVCYCHNPFRYAWNDRDATLARSRNPFVRALLAETLRRWREWDRRNARRTDSYLANSQITQARIRAAYGRHAKVVHPPVDTSRFHPGTVEDHYCVVSELMAHKRIDIAIEAFNRLRLPLVIVGDGPAARALRRLAGPTIRFTGRVSDDEVAAIMRTSRALIITAVEEFGIASVESQASGRPVIARGEGGALETVIGGVTGRFWHGGPEALADAVRQFDSGAVDPQACVQSARRFDVARFRAALSAEITAAELARTQGDRPRAEAQPDDAVRTARTRVG